MNVGVTSLDDAAPAENVGALDLSAEPIESDVVYIELPRAKPGTRDYRVEEDGTGRARLRIGPLVRAASTIRVDTPGDPF